MASTKTLLICLLVLLDASTVASLTWTEAFGAVAGGVVTAVAAPIVIPAAAAGLGFGAGGIAAGSLGATAMSWYGGKVAVGSIVASMQSVGATGAISTAFTAAASAGGAAVGGYMGCTYGKENC